MSKSKVSSIRKQLLGWLMIPIVSLCLVSAFSTYFIAMKITTQAYDAALMESARELANRITITDGHVAMDLPPAALAVFKDDNIDKVYYAAVSAEGVLIAGDRDLFDALKLSHPSHFRTSEGVVAKSLVRIVSLASFVPGHPEQKVFIYVAETVLKRQALIDQILIAVVLVQLLLIALASLAVWVGVSRGLAPLEVVRAAIHRRTQWDLGPVEEVAAPIEIQPLVAAIDDLLCRLNEDIEAQRRFVANAAHQLRTPLAGLKTQTELAMRQENMVELQRILKQVNRSASNVTRLVNQLLSLAKLEPAGASSLRQSAIDLNLVVKEATRDLVPYALENNIDLGFEDAAKPALITADSWSIRELITNLVDNAIRYCQAGGTVTVKVKCGDLVELSVEDDGPGIPYTEREHVFERFYRLLGNNVAGSGLGLAIVKEIAQSHNASVSIGTGSNGKGTLVAVVFPNNQISFDPEAKAVATVAISAEAPSEVMYK
jgi:two-component system, OmpR family, sensor histidine kinase TctE